MQWVLSFPLPLRYLLSAHPDVLAPVLKSSPGFRRSEAKAER